MHFRLIDIYNLLDFNVFPIARNEQNLPMYCMPCSTDHNAAHAFIDVRVTHFAPRFKYICNECQYYEKSYVEDCSN